MDCPVPGKCSGCRNTAACLRLQNLLGIFLFVYFLLLPEIHFNTCLVHGFFSLEFFSPFAEDFICNTRLIVLVGRGSVSDFSLHS